MQPVNYKPRLLYLALVEIEMCALTSNKQMTIIMFCIAKLKELFLPIDVLNQSTLQCLQEFMDINHSAGVIKF